MATPDFPSACDELVKAGALSSQARDKMVENYTEFEARRDEITASFKSGWIAVLDGQIYSDISQKGLTQQLKNKPGGDYAYAEQFGL